MWDDVNKSARTSEHFCLAVSPHFSWRSCGLFIICIWAQFQSPAGLLTAFNSAYWLTQVLLGSLSSVLSAMITQPSLYLTAEHVVLTESRFKLTQILHTEAFWNNVNTSHPPKLLHVLWGQVTVTNAQNSCNTDDELLNGETLRMCTSNRKHERWCSQCNVTLQVSCGLKGWESSGTAQSQIHRARILQHSHKGERCGTLLLPRAVERGPYPPQCPYLLLSPFNYSNTGMIKVGF